MRIIFSLNTVSYLLWHNCSSWLVKRLRLMQYDHEREKYFQKHTNALVRSRVCGVERGPLATARSHIMSGRKPWGPVSSDREGTVGVRQGYTAGVFWLRTGREGVKGTGIKDKGKVSTSQSVWCLAFGWGLGRQREAHPIRWALCSELRVLEGKGG